MGRCVVALALAGAGRPALAGDFLQIGATELYLAGATMGLPGLLLALPLLLRPLRGRPRAITVVAVVWLASMPWASLLLVDALSPGILGARHAFDPLAYHLRTWAPPTLAQLVVAGLLHLTVRPGT